MSTAHDASRDEDPAFLPPAVTHWLALAIALTLVDAVATTIWLHLGIAEEGNPLLAALADALGAIPAMLVRAGIGVGLLVALARLADRSTLARYALPVLTFVLAGVAAWHAVGAASAW